MYQMVGGRLVWVSHRAPRWKDWRGRLVYRERAHQMRAAGERA